MKPVLLCCNLGDGDAKKLKELCRRKDVRYRAVRPEEFSQRVGALCQAAEPLESPPDSGGFSEKILLFAHLGKNQMDVFFSEMRTARISPDILKAVLTDYNRQWSFTRLSQELKREKEQFERSSNPV